MQVLITRVVGASDPARWEIAKGFRWLGANIVTTEPMGEWRETGTGRVLAISGPGYWAERINETTLRVRIMHHGERLGIFEPAAGAQVRISAAIEEA